MVLSETEKNLVGYRFSPTDDEIITHFLFNKMRGYDFKVPLIEDVDICKSDPWELPDKLSLVTPYDEAWYFFNKPTLKKAKVDRKTKNGYWKVTGNDHLIWDSGKQIGFKKILVFHKGNAAKGVKTSWVIHEYHSNNAYENPVVFCRFKGNLDDKPANYIRGESSRRAASNF